MSNLSDTFWAYLAGYIDGEGSITMCQNGPRVIISNTHLETLEYIKRSLGGIGYMQTIKRNTRTTKTCYNLCFGTWDSEIVLLGVIPYMIEKKAKAEDLLSFIQTHNMRYGKRAQMAERRANRKKAVEEFRIRWGNKQGV